MGKGCGASCVRLGMRTLACLTMALALLSGCLQAQAAETTLPGSLEQASSHGPRHQVDESDEAPSAVLSGDPVAGKAPLAVRLTLAGSDPEGRALTWALDLDGDAAPDVNGSSLPATVDHTFDAGSHTVRLAVDDGNRVTLTSLEIVAEA